MVRRCQEGLKNVRASRCASVVARAGSSAWDEAKHSEIGTNKLRRGAARAGFIDQRQSFAARQCRSPARRREIADGQSAVQLTVTVEVRSADDETERNSRGDVNARRTLQIKTVGR